MDAGSQKVQSLCEGYVVFLHAALVCSPGHPMPASVDPGTASGIPSKDCWRGFTNHESYERHVKARYKITCKNKYLRELVISCSKLLHLVAYYLL